MTHRQAAFAAQTETMIKNLEKRGMEGYFFEDSAFFPLYRKAALYPGAAAHPSRNAA